MKKLYCASLTIPCLFHVNLNHSINMLPSHHSTHNLFYLLFEPCFFIQKWCFLQLQTRMTFFTSLAHVHKHLFWPTLPGWHNYMEKSHSVETGFLICESEFSVRKYILSSREVFHVISNVFFSEKYYLRGISYKYLVPVKWDKFLIWLTS